MGHYNDHRRLEGKHAYLGCSQSHWKNRSDEQLVNMYYSKFSTEIGTAMHALAQFCIVNKIKLNVNQTALIEVELTRLGIPRAAYDTQFLLETLVLFVNDAIGFRMDSEVILAYDEKYAFGTADAFRCDESKKEIRISDMKTGKHEANMEQLLLYAAQFCLEYNKKPNNYTFILRIYQFGEIVEYLPQAKEVEERMKSIVHATQVLTNNVER